MTVTGFAPQTEARFALARKAADAVLFEGGPPHGHRAGVPGNRPRRQPGVLVPPSWDAGDEMYDFQHTECLMEPKAGAALAVELRFLRGRRRTVRRAAGHGAFETVSELVVGNRTLVPLDEGLRDGVEVVVQVDELTGDGVTVPFHRPEEEHGEPVLDGDGHEVGRLVHRCEEISGVLRLSARRLEGPYRLLRLTAVVENTTAWTPGEDRAGDRDAAFTRSLAAAHLLLGLSAGSFLSMAEPPEWARQAVAGCRNLHTWPVLAGVGGRPDVVLSSPVVLGDHPAGRADGPRAPDAEPPQWQEPPARDTSGPAVLAGPIPVAGSRVRLNPGLRRTDAQDLFLRGRTARVEAVLDDVDGSVHLAVTLDDDPGADIRRAQGTFLYFRPDELTLLEDGA
ncbi:hypothetical protein AB0C59_30025 [Streptomyces sp. NPDC048664]|uniref:hypothetical protein n=1 Tax=Streptomyces sp. NPDC048664 TaxID=3154505 RepID=UPI003432920C